MTFFYYRFFGTLTIIFIILSTARVFSKYMIDDGDKNAKKDVWYIVEKYHWLFSSAALMSAIIYSITDIIIFGGLSLVSKLDLASLIFASITALFSLANRKSKAIRKVHVFFGVLTALLLLLHGFESYLI